MEPGLYLGVYGTPVAGEVMRLEVRVRDRELTEGLRAYVDRRLRFALSRFGRRIGLVTVRIADVNGPRGGVDKQCRIHAEVIPSGNVDLEETDADLYAAIDRAADRVRRAIARELERAREWPLERRLRGSGRR